MAALKKNVEKARAGYDSITELYHLADDLLNSIATEDELQATLHLSVVEPFVGHLAEATDALSEEYLHAADGGAVHKANRQRVEAAFRKLYLAFEDFNQRLHYMARETAATIRSSSDAVMAKMKRHVENLLVTFMEVMKISLSVIMGKSELEQLRVRDARVALLLHQMSTRPQEVK